MKHIAQTTLIKYKEGKAGYFAVLFCRSHLQKCPQCVQRLDKLKEEDTFLEEVKTKLNILSDPDLTEQAKKAGGTKQ